MMNIISMNSSVIYNAFGTEIKKKEDGSVSIDISSHLFWFAYCVDRPAVSTNHIAMVSGGLLSPILLCVVMERLLLRVSVCLSPVGVSPLSPFYLGYIFGCHISPCVTMEVSPSGRDATHFYSSCS